MASPCARSSGFRAAVAIALSLAVSGCAVEWTREHKLYCRMDETLGIRETLTFDRGAIDDAAWQRFEDDTIAHAFPHAFTTIGTTSSRVVTIAHADDAVSDAAAGEIVKRFRAEFPHDALRRERSAVCLSL